MTDFFICSLLQVTMERLHQFSVDGSRVLPRTCAEIVGGGEGSKATAFYTDVFDIERMKEALKSPTPWSLSWLVPSPLGTR